MTLHMRQPLPSTPDMEPMIDEALSIHSRRALYRDGLKRGFDLIVTLLAAVPILVVTLFFAALVALDGKTPFYVQKRVGRNGRTFDMWKLRSMVPDADSKLDAYLDRNPDARAEWTEAQKLRDDPRITPIGRVIRKTSLDELPQFWNVLLGDMSLVGPRPMLPSQQDMYPGTAYYALRPGITGFWQTSMRRGNSFAERARFDAAYLRKLSLVTDVAVLLRTVRVVIRGTGC